MHYHTGKKIIPELMPQIVVIVLPLVFATIDTAICDYAQNNCYTCPNTYDNATCFMQAAVYNQTCYIYQEDYQNICVNFDGKLWTVVAFFFTFGFLEVVENIFNFKWLQFTSSIMSCIGLSQGFSQLAKTPTTIIIQQVVPIPPNQVSFCVFINNF